MNKSLEIMYRDDFWGSENAILQAFIRTLDILKYSVSMSAENKGATKYLARLRGRLTICFKRLRFTTMLRTYKTLDIKARLNCERYSISCWNKDGNQGNFHTFIRIVRDTCVRATHRMID